MGKIYEALEKAQRERKGEKKPPLFVVLSPGERPSGGFEVAAENEMVALSRNIDALLETSPKKVIQFIGSQGGEGTSTVIRDFAMVSAARSREIGPSPGCRSPEPQSAPLLPPPTEIRVGGDLEKQEDLQESDLQNRENEPVCLPDPPRFGIPARSSFFPGDQGILGRGEGKIRSRPDRLRPASASPDGISLSRYVDGVVLVLEAEKTRKPVAENLKNRILQNGGNLLGMVFNNRRYHIPESVYKRL